jgi:hypothetical protein
MIADTERTLQEVVRIFEEIGIPYMVGGSVASSIHGIVRYTQDIDFVADVREEQIADLVAAMQDDFYIDADMILDALQTRTSFNVIHLPTMVKADIFLRKSDAWTQEVWSRRLTRDVGEEAETRSIYVASPEDMVLQKLIWFRLGGGIADRQWGDVTGILKVQAEALDYAYLHRWAAQLGLMELLEQALQDAGIAQPPPHPA